MTAIQYSTVSAALNLTCLRHGPSVESPPRGGVVQNSTSSSALNLHLRLWQSIESAPRDGTTILVWTREGCQLASYFAGRPGGWVEKDAYYLLTEDTTGLPTHWMPLPAAPDQCDT